jgi:prephenate dehydratase
MLAESSRTGFAALAVRAAAPSFPYFVAAEAQVPYGCRLLGRRGTRLEDVRLVLGHGSLDQCRPWLEEHLPGVPLSTRGSTLAAAAEVADGVALVATTATAAAFGFEVLAAEVDGGVVGNYWLVTRKPMFSATPKCVLASGRLPSQGSLTVAAAELADAGFTLRSLLAVPTGEALFEYDYLLALAGQGRLPPMEALGLRVIGAYSDRIPDQDGHRT